MLKIKVSNEGEVKIKVKDSNNECMIADMAIALHNFYNRLDDDCKEECREFFIENMDIILSPTDVAMRKAKEDIEKFQSEEKELIETIEDVAKALTEVVHGYKHQQD